MASDYATVYQISNQSIDWSFALAGVIPLFAGIVIVLGRRRFSWKQPNWLVAISLCGFGILWLSVFGLTQLRQTSSAVTSYEKGYYSLVDGVVSDFHPMPYAGHQEECFSVQDKRFCYSDFELGAGFRNTASHGGPIRAGLPVRIAYLGGTILRLEIPKDQVLSPAASAATLKSSEAGWNERTESDPVVQRMYIAFLFTLVCWTIWWNIQWKRVMRLWVRPPSRPRVEYVFRTFFALNLLGATVELAQQLQAHPLAKRDVGPTLETAAIMCSVVALMSAFGMWRADRRDRKSDTKLIAIP